MFYSKIVSAADGLLTRFLFLKLNMIPNRKKITLESWSQSSKNS